MPLHVFGQSERKVDAEPWSPALFAVVTRIRFAIARKAEDPPVSAGEIQLVL